MSEEKLMEKIGSNHTLSCDLLVELLKKEGILQYTKSTANGVEEEQFIRSYIGKGFVLEKKELANDELILKKIKNTVFPASIKTIQKEGATHVSHILVEFKIDEKEKIYGMACLMIWVPRKKE